MLLNIKKIKWPIYFLLLTIGLILNIRQFVTEQYMRFALRKEHVVISFTTTPYRINHIRPTMQSILAQNLKVDHIYLAIPYIFKRDNIEYVIPEWLLNDKRITIVRTEDYGPATKLLGVLTNVKLDNNTIIITFDDDITYPKNTALHLAYAAMKDPNTAFGLSGVFPAYLPNQKVHLDRKNYEGLGRIWGANEQAVILQGYAGVAYRKKFFNSDIFDIVHAPRECINSDDLYLSFYLAKHNIVRLSLKNRYLSKDNIRYDNPIGHKSDALHVDPDVTLRHQNCIAYMKNLNPNVNF